MSSLADAATTEEEGEINRNYISVFFCDDILSPGPRTSLCTECHNSM